jgi:hypothetical protein
MHGEDASAWHGCLFRPLVLLVRARFATLRSRGSHSSRDPRDIPMDFCLRHKNPDHIKNVLSSGESENTVELDFRIRICGI